MKRSEWIGAVLLLALVTGHGVSAAAVDGSAVDWRTIHGDSNETAYSRLDQITSANVGRLGLSWYRDLPGEVSLEATPLAINGVLYFTGTYGAVYAVDGASGRLLWKFDPQTWKYDPAKMHYLFLVNRGVAYADGRIFSAALDGRLFALDARTGKVLWSEQTLDPKSMQNVSGAPCVFDGKVIIGNSGGDLGQRGYVTAYDAATGREVWRFYTVPGSPAQNRGDPAMERAATTWAGRYRKRGAGGGAVWDSIVFDRRFDRIYIGVGNPSLYDAAVRSRSGADDLYTDSIVALDARTGKLVWSYQEVPRDEWDFDAAQTTVLADLTIHGERLPVLMQAPKDGFFYVIDRRTGKLISAAKLGKVTWAERIDQATGRPVVAKSARYEVSGEAVVWPSTVGAHSWQAMSFSPQTGLVYIPYMQLGMRFTVGKPVAGAADLGGVSVSFPALGPDNGKGALLAWDPVHQRAIWRVPHDTLWNGGTLATKGNLVFQGTEEGTLSAYDASTGRSLWSFNAGLGIIAAPMTYTAGGRQYVSVLVGFGGAVSLFHRFMDVRWSFGAPRRLLTFELGGRAWLPPSATADGANQPLDDPSYRPNPRAVAAGGQLYAASCSWCHGLNLQSPGAPGPDLRASRIALNPGSFWAVLHRGILLPDGMPRFETLTRSQVMQIYAYIRAGAHAAVEARTGATARDAKASRQH